MNNKHRNTSTLPENFDYTIYAKRRQQVVAHLRKKGGGIAILPTALELTRNRDNTYPYRADSYFYYLTGFTEPESWLVITDAGKSFIFCREKDPQKEVWTGYRLGPDAATQALGVDAAYPVDELDEHLPALLSNQPAIWYPFATHAGLEQQIDEWLQVVRSHARSGALCPGQLHDLCALLDEMRLIKDAYEIDLMRRAAQISAYGHARAMQKCAQMIHAGQDIREYHLEAELQHEFRRHGAQDVSFNSIVAAGANACVLHYRAGATHIQSGDMVLIDAGCEYEYYAGDISRTFPANGKFTGPQRALYELVLAAQHAAQQHVKPGLIFKAPHQAAVHVLSQGLLDLGLLNKNQHGTVEDIIANQDYFRFYMHNTSHWLGLDVHDCGSYVDTSTKPLLVENKKTGETTLQRPSRILQEGMVLTLEPGLYIPASNDVPEQFHNIGIRIEDDALVTEQGCELITRNVPVDMDEIQALMKS